MAKNELAKAFSGFVVYTSNGQYPIDLEKIPSNEHFEYLKYKIAEEDQISSIGFEPVIEMEISPDGEVISDEEYVHSVGKFDVVKITQSKRKVPGNEVKKIVQAKIKKALAEAEEKGQTLKINKELKDVLKDEAIRELLPRCFIDEYSTYVFLDKQTEKLYVAVPSHKKAEDLTAFLRKTLGSLAVIPLTTEKPIVDALTRFVTGQLNDVLTLGNFVQMEDFEGQVAWKKESLYNSEAKDLIESSEKLVTKLAMNYDGVLNFTVDAEYVFSGLKFESYVTADASSFSGTFLLIANEISKAVKELLAEINSEK